MHPILFHIPLPHRALKLWWALAAVAVLALLYAGWSQRKQQKQDAMVGAIVAAALGAAGYYWRAVEYNAENVPIYSYGVMLGLSLVVGWYITLPLAKKIGLPEETMANCYVVTAVAALAGSRLLFVVTNLDMFHETSEYFAFRKGGLVAYGGFLGGFVGSWLFLARHRIRLMPWADVAVPSLAAGLFITRIGCYLYGCDFGQRLSDTAPGFLKKAGTFPKLPEGTLGYFDNGSPVPGSPAFAHHMDMCTRGVYKAADCVGLKDGSFPVHPTQLYEAFVGLGILALLFWVRKHQKFRGQVFLVFVFAYGFCRFLLELVRDDDERGSLPFHTDRYILVTFALVLMAVSFAYGFSRSIQNPTLRIAARLVAAVPAVVAFLTLRTGAFVVDDYSYSTSQFVGFVTAALAGLFYALMWEDARRSPKLAMALGLEDTKIEAKEPAPRKRKKDEDEEAADEEPAPRAKKGGKKPAPKPAVKRPAPKPAEEDEDEDEEASGGEPEPEKG